MCFTAFASLACSVTVQMRTRLSWPGCRGAGCDVVRGSGPTMLVCVIGRCRKKGSTGLNPSPVHRGLRFGCRATGVRPLGTGLDHGNWVGHRTSTFDPHGSVCHCPCKSLGRIESRSERSRLQDDESFERSPSWV